VFSINHGKSFLRLRHSTWCDVLPSAQDFVPTPHRVVLCTRNDFGSVGSVGDPERNSEREVEVSENDMEQLSEQAMTLLTMEIDDLYASLGGQLLGHNMPLRAVGIVTYLSGVRRFSVAKTFLESLPATPGLTELNEGLRIIYEELRRDGIRFLTEVSADLRDVLCREEIVRLSDHVTASSMRVIIALTSSGLKLPRQLDPIAATVTAIILKLGLRGFCAS
jgi:hypothetical protein